MCGGGDSVFNLNPAHNPIAEENAKLDLSGSGSTVLKAFQTGNWGSPFGSEASGFDVLGAGPLGLRGIGGSSDNPRDREIGRGVGSFFAGEGIGQAVGASGAGAGAVSGGGEGSTGLVGGGGEVGAGGAAGSTGSGLSMSASSGSGLSADVPAATVDGAQGLVAPAGTEFAGSTTTTPVGAGGAILSAAEAAPLFNLSPETAGALGISQSTPNLVGGGNDPAMSPGAGSVAENLGSGFEGTDPATSPDQTPQSKPASAAKPAAGKSILGLKPTTAALLGISGLQAISKPKQTSADKSIEAANTPALQQANAVISSGGTSGPEWATQKESIDATIDQQIEQQTQAIIQQAINSGQGSDSLVVKQQINQLKTNLETQRQNLYSQQQQKNVQAALSQLGISDQALSNVSANQFNSSTQAKQQAAQTASTALLLQALG